MTRGSYQAVCTGYGRRSAFAEQSVVVDTGDSDWLSATTAAGPKSLSDEIAGLLDISAVVYRAERQLTPRRAGNRNVRFDLVVPVPSPDRWGEKPKALLEEILGLLGAAEWRVRLVQRRGRARRHFKVEPVERTVSRIALLSGGLDSTSGLGARLVPRAGTQLCSFYTSQLSLQQQLASTLGFAEPTQWRMHVNAGRGRSFFYRSLLFLALAIATAETFKAREIVQFENGILASAIPPVPSLAMTKHAHPKLHRLLERLLKSLTGDEWRIVNPLWNRTKREAVEAMRQAMGTKVADDLALSTRSCWNLSTPSAFGVRTRHGQTKRAHTQCGVCIPCIVRRTALPDEEFAFDLNDPTIRGHAKLGARFLEYAEFALALHRAKDQAELRAKLPGEALQLLDENSTDLDALERLLRAFAGEFLETFKVDPRLR